jgi:squalene monooxygenase
MTWDKHYDVVIVGAGIAGSALAHALATLPRPSAPTALDPSSETSWQGSYNVEPPRPMRICVLERSLAPPDRIVGELLQPGGMRALGAIGMAACTEGIDAVPVRGYAVVRQKELVEIPYPEGAEGRSFHHGRFIGKLREAVMNVAEAGKGGGRDVLAQVDVIEATVQELVECDFTNRIIGVRAVLKTPSESATVPALPTDGPSVHPPPADTEKKETFFADLVVIADGCFSNFRSQVLGPSGNKPTTKSHFVGLVLEDVKLPIPHHGTVCLVKNSGPVLLYQIAEHDTRMLVDVKAPLPSDLKVRFINVSHPIFCISLTTDSQGHILMNIVPQLLPALQPAVRTALEKDRLRRMPNSFLPPTRQSKRALRQRPVKEGVVLIGDAWNMRHPLTGGGMTVAFNDVEILAKALVQLPPGELGFGDWERVRRVVEQWETDRRPLASTVNILSVALYDLFGAEGE